MTWMRVRGNMMKMREQSWNARNHFGSFLREKRDSLSMSLSDMGYVLNLNYGTVWNWEIGGSFPANIIRLKQLALVYPGVHDEMKLFKPDVKPRRRYPFEVFMPIRELTPTRKPSASICANGVLIQDTRQEVLQGGWGCPAEQHVYNGRLVSISHRISFA
jgi:transcriptional regulator with XRE-family HTH domain